MERETLIVVLLQLYIAIKIAKINVYQAVPPEFVKNSAVILAQVHTDQQYHMMKPAGIAQNVRDTGLHVGPTIQHVNVNAVLSMYVMTYARTNGNAILTPQYVAIDIARHLTDLYQVMITIVIN